MTKHDRAINKVSICPNQVVNFYFLSILKIGGYANRSRNAEDCLKNSIYWFLL